MLLFSKIYEFYCLYGIEILLSGATGADFFPIFITFSHFLPLFLNSSYEALIYILLVLHIKIHLFIANSTNNPLKTYYADNLLKRKLKEKKFIKQK